MRIALSAALFVALLVTLSSTNGVAARKSSRPTHSAARRGGRSHGGSGGRSKPTPRSAPRRRAYEEEEEEEEYDDEEEESDFGGFPDEDDEMDSDAAYEEEEEVLRPVAPKRRSGGRAPPPGKRGPPPRKARGGPPPKAPRRKPAPSGRRGRFDDEYDMDDDYRPRRSPGPSSRRRGPPPRGRGRRSGRGEVVPYAGKAAGAWGVIAGVREYIPDPSSVRQAATSTLSAARERTTKLSSNIYREVKGLTSSELEQVMLKATRPDDTPVKGKHVERLVGVTYQISGKYDIYDAVLRKLWNKMAEKDWRTTMKSVYILHRFSCDGGPEHQEALKQRLRQLRKTRDPKRKGARFFDSKILIAGDSTPENVKYRAFLSRYAHFVLTRAQTFGGMFNEISLETKPRSSGKKGPKPEPPLCSEHLKFAQMVLKAGLACGLKDGEECENTALSAERVASDLIGLTTAVAVALNRELKSKSGKDTDPALVQEWCKFYSEELLPQTKGMVKKTSAKLDAYGLYLPSRMGASVSQELLQKGLRGDEDEEESPSESPKDVKEEASEEQCAEEATGDVAEQGDVGIAMKAGEVGKDKEVGGDEEDEEDSDKEETEIDDEYDEYDYEEEEYYDDE